MTTDCKSPAVQRTPENGEFTPRFHIPFVCECVCGPEKSGAPGAIPTRDLPLRRRTLYATELREPEPVNRKW